jgi:hypothetical protein
MVAIMDFGRRWFSKGTFFPLVNPNPEKNVQVTW